MVNSKPRKRGPSAAQKMQTALDEQKKIHDTALKAALEEQRLQFASFMEQVKQNHAPPVGPAALDHATPLPGRVAPAVQPGLGSNFDPRLLAASGASCPAAHQVLRSPQDMALPSSLPPPTGPPGPQGEPYPPPNEDNPLDPVEDVGPVGDDDEEDEDDDDEDDERGSSEMNLIDDPQDLHGAPSSHANSPPPPLSSTSTSAAASTPWNAVDDVRIPLPPPRMPGSVLSHDALANNGAAWVPGSRKKRRKPRGKCTLTQAQLTDRAAKATEGRKRRKLERETEDPPPLPDAPAKIPRPDGQHGRDYNAGWILNLSKKAWAAVCLQAKHEVIRVLDAEYSIENQNPIALAGAYTNIEERVRDVAPVLSRCEDNWGAYDAIKQYLVNTRMRPGKQP